MRLRSLSFAILVAAGLPAGFANASGEHRELTAHQHGHGSLNIAIDGQTLQLELHAPGDDIVGFESKPKSKAQKARVNAAKLKLSKIMTVFGVPADATCKLGKHDVEFELEGEHSEFHVEAELTCTNIAKLSGLKLTYFDMFERAQELDVQIATSKGQKKVEATRKAPTIDLSGLK